MAFKSIHEEMLEKNSTTRAPRPNAGHKHPSEIRPALLIAQGKLGQRPTTPNRHGRKFPIITMENALTENVKHT